MSEEKHVFQVGETVAVCFSGKPKHESTVTKVRKYKHRTKITIEGGAEYDADGVAWDFPYASRSIAAMTPEVVAGLQHAKNVRTIVHAVEWLSDGEAARVAALIREIRQGVQP